MAKLISRSYFNQIASDYAKENNKLDYAGLAKLVGSHILCNNITEVDPSIFDNVQCGSLYEISDDALYDYEDYTLECKENEEEPMTYKDWLEENREDYEREVDIFQYFLVDDIYWLEKSGELVLYSDLLDCYVWCITHCGTGWSYVLTDIEPFDDWNEYEGDK